MLTFVALGLSLILLLKWILRRKRDLRLLQKLGYRVPPTSFIGGNLVELFSSPCGDLVTQERWMSELAEDFGASGKILGWYRGPRPVIYATDPDFLKEVFIKQSETYIDRPMLDRSDNVPHLIMLKGSRWKQVRSTLTPTFSAAKMKKMATIMTEAISILLNVVEKHSLDKTEANFYDLYQGLTLDVIGQCGLGMKVNCQQDPQDKLLRMVKSSMKRQIDLTAVIASFFPELEDLIAWFYRGGRKKTNDVIISWCNDILQARRRMHLATESEKPVDSLQLMMEAADGGKKLTDDEITGNAFVFILAGYETTATSLAFTSYLIAAHQDVQDRIYAEIQSAQIDKMNAEELAEAVGKLPYLDMVWKEALRMYPPIPLHFGRWADAEKVIMGKVIPKGSAVMIPTWFIHHDPNTWPDPWKFDPERFSPENRDGIKEMSYLPFGEGPRKCIGWRFANLEAKLALVLLLKRFKLKLGPSNAKGPLRYRNKGISLAPENDAIFLVPELRQ